MKDILQKINEDVSLFVKEQESRNKNIERLYKSYEKEDFSNLKDIKEKIESKKIDNVILAGMGSSMYALKETECKFFQNNMKAQTFEASKAAMYANNLVDDKTLLVIVSQSGTSPEVIDLVSKINNDVNVISITNNKDSLLNNFKACYEIHADFEYYIAHNSYINTLILLDKITDYLFSEKNKTTLKDIIDILNIQDQYIECNWSDTFEVFENIKSIDFITHANNVGTGLNTALLFREGLGIMANTFTINEYYHGEHLVNNKDKLTVFIDVDATLDDKKIMKEIELINHNIYLFINYKDVFDEIKYEIYKLRKPIVQMALFNRIVEYLMLNANK